MSKIDIKQSAIKLEEFLRENLGWTTVEYTQYCKKCDQSVKSPYCPDCGKKSTEHKAAYDTVIDELSVALQNSVVCIKKTKKS